MLSSLSDTEHLSLAFEALTSIRLQVTVNEPHSGPATLPPFHRTSYCVIELARVTVIERSADAYTLFQLRSHNSCVLTSVPEQQACLQYARHNTPNLAQKAANNTEHNREKTAEHNGKEPNNVAEDIKDNLEKAVNDKVEDDKEVAHGDEDTKDEVAEELKDA